MILYTKIHPSAISYLISYKEYGIINIVSDLNKNIAAIKNTFERLKSYNITQIILEKPFLKLIGDNQKKIAQDIIHIQRLTGAFLTLSTLYFPDAAIEQISARKVRQAVYGTDYLSKDTQLSEAEAILDSTKDFSALEILSLHDCLVLKSYMNNKQMK